MKSRKNSHRILSLIFLFIILNSNCLVVLNAFKVQKHGTRSSSTSTSELKPGRERRFKKAHNNSTNALELEASSSQSKHEKKSHPLALELKSNSKAKAHGSSSSSRMAKTKIDPMTAAIIVKYTAAVITKILDYGTGKVKEKTRSLFQRAITRIEESKLQWRGLLETQCTFFRMIRQITKVYMMSSDYEHYLVTNGGYAPLQRTVANINSVREKILTFIDQKVLDSCGETDSFLADYIQMADSKKQELENELKKLSEDHMNTSVNSLNYVVEQIKKNGPPAAAAPETPQEASKFAQIKEVMSDGVDIVNNLNNDLLQDNGWAAIASQNGGQKVVSDLKGGQREDFVTKYNEQAGKWIGDTVGFVATINELKNEVQETLSPEDQQIVGQQAAEMEKTRRYVAIGLKVFSIVSKIVEYSGSALPEWTATIEAGFELFEKYLKYKSLVYTRRFVVLNDETKRTLDSEINKCRVFELIPAGIKLGQLFTGSVMLGFLRGVVGPFIDAAVNVFKMLVSVYKLVAAIVGYYKAKRNTQEIEQLLAITTDNIAKHYNFEKCSATLQLYKMLQVLEDERKQLSDQVTRMETASGQPANTENPASKLAFMKQAIDEDINIFLSSFTDAEIKAAEAVQAQTPTDRPLLRAKIFYRKHMSAINSIAVARTPESVRSLLDNGFIQYIVLAENLNIMICRGCSNRYAVSLIEQLAETTMAQLATLSASFNTNNGAQRLSIINIGTDKAPSYLKIVESRIVENSAYVTEFSILNSKLDKGMLSNYVGNGLYQNFQFIPNYNVPAKLIVSAQPFQNTFAGTAPTQFRAVVRIANILTKSWLVLSFDESATGDLLANYNFGTANGITHISGFALSLDKSVAVFDSYIALQKQGGSKPVDYKSDNYKIMEKNLLIPGSPTPPASSATHLDIFQTLRDVILCTDVCFYKDTPINKAFRINDEEAFANPKAEAKDTWEVRQFSQKCPANQAPDFTLAGDLANKNSKITITEACTSNTENKLLYDSNYIVRRFNDATIGCSPGFGDIARLRRGFFFLYLKTHKSENKDVEIYIRPKFEYGWVPLGATMDEQEKTPAVAETCWNEFFPVETIDAQLKQLQDRYTASACKRNNLVHFIRSYRSFIAYYMTTDNRKLKPEKSLPTLKYYRFKYGKFFAGKTNTPFPNYTAIKKGKIGLNNKDDALFWLSKIHNLCKDKFVFLPAQLSQGSTGLTFTTNAEGDVFLQESSEEQTTKIDKVYYIEIFSVSGDVPRMVLEPPGDNDRVRDHRQLFDYGFRPLLVPVSLGTGINDGVLISSKGPRDNSKTLFRIWVRDDLRLKRRRRDICPT